ncbi:hypothetical protein P4120_21130 [Bacillus thuringiensis]|nr:hypothetical protein [Bacillus thuringiensis]
MDTKVINDPERVYFPLVSSAEFILKPGNITSPGNNHQRELESIK